MERLRSRIELWAQIAGLSATAWLLWWNSAPPDWHHRWDLSFAAIALALGIGVCAWTWGAAIGLIVRLTLWRLNRATALLPMSGTFRAAIWFAPATILILQLSVVGLTAGLALVLSAARLICAPARPMEYEEALDPGDAQSRHFGLALVVSAGFETAIVSFTTAHWELAAGLLTASTAMVAALAIGSGAWTEDRPPDLPRSVMGLVLTVLLASLLVRITGGSGWGFGWGSRSGDAVAGKTTSPPAQMARSEDSERLKTRADRTEPPPEAAANIAGDYPGVILWPEIKPVTTLIAPPLAGSGAFAPAFHPLTIPFGGEYWMFRWPYPRPPKNSYFKRGTPVAMSFRTTDRARLLMEARHKLFQPITSRCCNRIEVAILNADPYPGTITLELALIDSETPGAFPLSLGVAAVTSVPDLKVNAVTPVREAIQFAFPPTPHLDQFDQIRVIFHRTLDRADKSARISIERFVLNPSLN